MRVEVSGLVEFGRSPLQAIRQAAGTLTMTTTGVERALAINLLRLHGFRPAVASCLLCFCLGLDV